MSRPLSLVFVCILLIGVAVVPAGIGAAVDTLSSSADQSEKFATPDGFASATFNIEVYENGSARWTFSYYTPTENESERSQFREFASRFESQETDLWVNFKQRARALTQSGSDSTGRNMTATGFQRDASLDAVGNRGQVRMSFLWVGFARTNAGQVLVGDVFEGEFYIAQNQWLVFETGPNLSFVADSVDPTPTEFSGSSIATSDTVTWFGEQRFTDNRPRLTFTVENDATSGDGGGAADQTTTTSAIRNSSSRGALPMVLAGIVVLALAIGAGVAWRSGLFGSTPADESPAAEMASAESEPAPTTATESQSDPEPAAEAASEPTVPEEELLTDEDRVLNLLESNGGRMKQANIVDETEWSKSKVSMLLSDMEDDELISKLRVGRENIVSLSGHEPDAAGSPFDDED